MDPSIQNSTSTSSNTNSSSVVLLVLLIIFFIISIIEGGVILNLNEKQNNSTIAVTPSPNLSFATPALLSPTPRLVNQKVQFNKIFMFPVENQGVEIAQIKYEIKTIELTKEVFVNNQKATISNDKIILAMEIELTNDYEAALGVFAGDYLRLLVNDEDKLLAPEMQSDPVELRPHSTKETKIGFVIRESDKNLVLQAGPLGGEKEIINIDKLF